jgi:hypothetical protein
MFSVTRTGYQAVANAIWSLVAIASRGVNVELWRGSAPNVLQSGRVDAHVGSMGVNVTVGSNLDKTNYHVASVSDKNGYSLAPDQAVNVTKVGGVTIAGGVAGFFAGDTYYHRGSFENVLVGGRRDVHVGSMGVNVTVGTNLDKTNYHVNSVSDKSGYSLAQGSYDVTEFCQRGTGSGGAVGISTVTMSKTQMTTVGWSNPDGAASPCRGSLAPTAVTVTVSSTAVTNTYGFEIADYAG